MLFGYNYFYYICLVIDTSISTLIHGIMLIFSSLANKRIFNNDIISVLTTRAYIVISVCMLFVLAYSIFKMIINPDEATKGKTSGFSLVKRIIVSIAVIAFTPAIFNFAYGLQNSVIDNNVIGRVILGSSTDVTGDAASELVTNVFTASCYLSESAGEEAIDEYTAAYETSLATGNVTSFSNLIPYMEDHQVIYHNIIGIILSCVILYILFTFCFDLGVRVIKLGFLQLIAPIPAIMHILPGKADSLSKWIKESLKCYFEVFVRMFVLYFAIFMFLVINRKMDTTGTGILAPSTASYTCIIRYFMLFAVLLFIKQAPKLIGDIFGIKTESSLFSIKQRFKDAASTAEPVGRVVTGAANKAVGLVGGMYNANQAYNAGIAAGNTGSKSKKALALINGARIGMAGGVKGMGSAYTYEQLMQQSYSMDYGEGKDSDQIKNAVLDRAREFVGRKSRYDEEIDLKALERDKKNAPYKKSIQNIRDKVGSKIDKIEKEHSDTISANKKVNEKSAAVLEAVREDNIKKGNIQLTNREIFDNYVSSLDKKIKKADSDGNMSLKAQLEAKMDRAITFSNSNYFKEREKDFVTSKIMDTTMKESENLNLPNTTIQAIFDVYNDGLDQLDKLYLQDKDNYSSKVQLKISDALAVIRGDKDAGYIANVRKEIRDQNNKLVDVVYTREVDENGNDKITQNYNSFHVVVKDEDGNDIDTGELDYFKIKRESGKLVNDEEIIKNNRLINDTEEVSVYNPNTKTLESAVRTLYEYKDIEESFNGIVTSNNKDFEKYKESRNASEEIQKRKLEAQKLIPKFRAKHNDKK